MGVVRNYLPINPAIQKTVVGILVLLLFSFSFDTGFANPIDNIDENQNINSDFPDEIIFYSNGDVFSPFITLQAEAEVIWTWADSTTSNSLNPTKDYGSAQLRPNRLKVTPWSAVRRINIGYDAEDGGSPYIELVADQNVSSIENLNLVGPYLKEWCSSYNDITELNFSNFTELETIECYLSYSLKNVNLQNTEKLKRACFEENALLELDVSSSPILEDLRAAVNDYTEITFANQTDKLWHICVHRNQFSDQHFFNDISKFPDIADLFIYFTNQQGELVIPKTNTNRAVLIEAYRNEYTSIDFRGALKNQNFWGKVDMDHNKISEVNITGCVQIKELDLSYNNLQSSAVDQVLKQVDDYGTSDSRATIDLRNNEPPTNVGLIYKSNLEQRGWTVYTDENIPIESITVNSTGGTSISTDNGTLQMQAVVLPTNATTKAVSWSVLNETGKATISSSGLLSAIKNGTVSAIATAMDGSGVTGELQISISNVIYSPNTQRINLDAGWNIFSINNSPDSLDLKQILQPNIDNGSLIKIQDEIGNTLEDWGVYGGWQNNIGDISLTEAYKIKVNSDDSLEIIGDPIVYPFAIPVKSGWNLIGYPQLGTVNGMDIVQELLDNNTLLKVQDEQGNSIEDWGIFGGWQNNIGNFSPGEGYKVKVNTDDTLWIYESYPKSTLIQAEQIATNHFIPAIDGNGFNHMNFNLVRLPIDEFEIGDEIAIFDGEICVGAISLMSHHISNQLVSVNASARDDYGMSGFTEGNPFTLKLWKANQNMEINLEPEILEGTNIFTSNESSLLNMEKSLTTVLTDLSLAGSSDIKCYPNPFNEEVTVEINLAKDAQVEVEVLNQMGQRVRFIAYKQKLNSGLHKLTWNGTNTNNKVVTSGIYYLRVNMGGDSVHRKIVYTAQ